MEPKYEERAREIGEEHGRNAASWVELDEATAEAIDRAGNVFDVLEPSGPLSGEWADGYSVRQLSDDLAIDEDSDEFDDLCTAYEDAYWEAFSESVEAQVERLRGPILDLDKDQPYAVGAGTVAWRYIGQTFGGLAQLVMVGDDKVWTFEPDEVRPLGEDAYCHECGQVGCTADGRDREDDDA